MTIKKFIDTFVSVTDRIVVTVMDADDTSRQVTAIAVELVRGSGGFCRSDKSPMEHCPALGNTTLIVVTAPLQYDLYKEAVRLLAKTTAKEFDTISAAVKNGTIGGQCYSRED